MINLVYTPLFGTKCLFIIGIFSCIKPVFSKPLYRIYGSGGTSKSLPPSKNLTKQGAHELANNFTFLMGGYTKSDLSQVHAVNPHGVKFLSYISTGSAGATEIESHSRFGARHFWTGNLTVALEPTSSIIKLQLCGTCSPLVASTAPLSQDMSSVQNGWVVWLRIKDELMRINNVSNVHSNANLMHVGVTRGWAGTTVPTLPYGVGEAVFFPGTSKLTKTITINNYSDTHGFNQLNAQSNQSGYNYKYSLPFYRVDFNSKFAVDSLVNFTVQVVQTGWDGAWFDTFRGNNAIWPLTYDSMGQRKTGWDFDKNCYLTWSSQQHYQRKRLQRVWKGIYTQLGNYPLLIANNLLASWFPEDGGSRSFLEEEKRKNGNSTSHGFDQRHMQSESFKPLNAASLEAWGGSESGPGCYHPGSSDPSEWYIVWPSVANWRKHVQVVMDAAQRELPAIAMIGQAGCVGAWLEGQGAVRDQFEMFAYASFLLGVEPSSTSKVGKGPLFGVPSFYANLNGTNHHPRLHERYGWPIGVPTVSYTYTDIDMYRQKGNHSSYVRPFSNGIVVVNPSNTTVDTVELGAEYIDPSTGTVHNKINVAVHTGFVLLRNFLLSDQH